MSWSSKITDLRSRWEQLELAYDEIVLKGAFDIVKEMPILFADYAELHQDLKNMKLLPEYKRNKEAHAELTKNIRDRKEDIKKCCLLSKKDSDSLIQEVTKLAWGPDAGEFLQKTMIHIINSDTESGQEEVIAKLNLLRQKALEKDATLNEEWGIKMGFGLMEEFGGEEREESAQGVDLWGSLVDSESLIRRLDAKIIMEKRAQARRWGDADLTPILENWQNGEVTPIAENGYATAEDFADIEKSLVEMSDKVPSGLPKPKGVVLTNPRQSRC